MQQPAFAPGDKVWLLRTNIKTARPSSKLDVHKLGPFEIVEAVNSRSFRLALPPEMSRIHPVFHVSLLEPFNANTIEGCTAPAPPLMEVEGEIEYEVEAILDSRLYHSKLQYLVSWLGYNEQTWEPPEHVAHCPELVAKFHS